MLKRWYELGLELGLFPATREEAEERVEKIKKAIEELVEEGGGVIR